MALTRPSDLTLRPPRIDQARFKQILVAHASPAVPESALIWNMLLGGEVDPSFALGQFLRESIYGTRGHAVKTKSWGNILWDATWTPARAKYAPGNGYTYASYPSWAEGVRDYVAYVRRYAVTRDSRYGGVTDTIDGCTARWVGDALLSEEHVAYVTGVVSAINNEYEFVPETFVEVGDRLTYAGLANATSLYRYPVANGTPLYRGTNGDVLKIASFDPGPGNCHFFGPVGQPWSDSVWAWGMIRVGTSAADKLGTLLYVKNPDKAKVVKAAVTARLASALGLSSHPTTVD